ncbi:hypothetical protein [Pseudomonas sp. A014]|uniref:hypothetical protein n=1 Tax=Pseudomonas sp. A014 TaxID=3458058 RepID=UPI004036F081
MKQPTIPTFNLLIAVTSALIYLAISLAVLRFIAPALVSSKDDALVVIGFTLIGIWLVASIGLLNHLVNKRRAPAATTKEEDK